MEKYFRLEFMWSDCSSRRQPNSKFPMFETGGGSYMDFSYHSYNHVKKHFYFYKWCFLTIHYTKNNRWYKNI